MYEIIEITHKNWYNLTNQLNAKSGIEVIQVLETVTRYGQYPEDPKHYESQVLVKNILTDIG